MIPTQTQGKAWPQLYRHKNGAGWTYIDGRRKGTTYASHRRDTDRVTLKKMVNVYWRQRRWEGVKLKLFSHEEYYTGGWGKTSVHTYSNKKDNIKTGATVLFMPNTRTEPDGARPMGGGQCVTRLMASYWKKEVPASLKRPHRQEMG